MGRIGKEALAYWLGDDLEVLVHQLGSKIESAEEMTVLVSARQRKASFKITLVDGRVFKARRLKTREHWNAFVALSPLTRHLNFARIIAAHGMSCIEQWVPGSPLLDEAVSPEQAFRAGEVLGQLHATPVPASDTLPAAPDGRWYRGRIDRQLAALVARGALGAATVQSLSALAVEHEPVTFDTGLIHGDFCAANIVVGDDGQIVLVDNESLRLGALDFDLARCRSRWPMTEALSRAFFNGYQCYRSLEAVHSNGIFWDIAALSLTAYVQTKHNKSPGTVLEELRRLGFPN